jgi:ribosomal protein S18 acetylase RimI-like enzyme
MAKTIDVSRRPATPADTSFARRAHHAAVRDIVERQFGPWNEEQQNDFFVTDWNVDTAEIILADGINVGYCIVEDRPSDIHLRELVLDPAHQGCGIGTHFIRQLQDSATQQAKPIRLGTLHENRAVALYRRLGFEPIGRTSTHVLLEWRPSSGQ